MLMYNGFSYNIHMYPTIWNDIQVFITDNYESVLSFLCLIFRIVVVFTEKH